ncbi:MAG TPA: RNA-binding protein [Phycisphaerales bacterium]|nr:RNA-binding protein [Phycisphaerales bacterium]
MKLYVGNLSFSTTEAELREMFSAHGQVDSASIVMDRETGRSRGFGFVEMGDAGQAQAAITAMNGSNQGGRTLVVNEARAKEAGGSRGGGGWGGGGGGRGGGGGGWGGGGGRGDRGDRGSRSW